MDSLTLIRVDFLAERKEETKPKEKGEEEKGSDRVMATADPKVVSEIIEGIVKCWSLISPKNKLFFNSR